MEVEKILEEKFNGVEIPETIKDKLVVVLSEYEENLAKANSDKEFHKSEMKKAIDKRDEVKNHFRDYKTQVVSGQAPEVQEVSKKVLEYETKFDTLEKTLEDYKSKHELAETKLKEINEKQRTQLLETLPVGSDVRKFAEGLDDLDKLNSFVLVAKKEKIGVDGGKAGGDFKVDVTKSYDDYTSKELNEMKTKYTEAYNTLYRKKYPNVKQ
jgi:chromosome segregation ATPase